jgi:Xaa-Pro aminopeptidase
LDAYIIPSSDEHQSEYVCDRSKIRAWISGFDGSAGTAVITNDHAGLWTDSRYFLQAEEQLADNEFQLHKIVKQGTPEFITWLCENLPRNSSSGM